MSTRKKGFGRGIILHEQFIHELVRGFSSLDEESAELVDDTIIKLVNLSDRVARLRKQVEAYEALPLCNGVAYWPKDNSGYMKCNHGVGVECPMHGRPRKANGRLRIGIGRDADVIQATKKAMRDYALWEKSKRELSEAESLLQQLQRRLRNALSTYSW
jgi:hypothetical protein